MEYGFLGQKSCEKWHSFLERPRLQTQRTPPKVAKVVKVVKVANKNQPSKSCEGLKVVNPGVAKQQRHSKAAEQLRS